MKKRIVVIACVVVAVLLAVACAVFLQRGPAAAETAENDEVRQGLIGQHEAAATTGSDAAKPANTAKGAKKSAADDADNADDDDDDGDMSPEDEKRMEAISDALEKDDYKAVAALIADVQTSTNAEVRSELVDALGIFGKKALVDLLPFMADPDADVAESARDEWTSALGEITNERSKCRYIESATAIITDEDALESMMLELTDCDEKLAIQTIVNIVSSGTEQAVAAAKEQYEFITGEEYTNVADAEAWLQENYEPDDDE